MNKSTATGWVSWRTVCLAMCITILASACRKKSPPPDTPIRLGIQNNAVTSLVAIAHGKGLFKKNGIGVELVRYPSGKLALQGLFRGEVDVATCADMPIVDHSFERQDFWVVSTIASTERGAWIIARRDHGIQVPADLRGKRIGTQQNSAVHFFLSMFLLYHVIPESDVTIRFYDAADLPEALVDGQIDAFSMRNPFIAEAREKLGAKAVEFRDSIVYRQTFNLVASRRFMSENPDRVEALLRGLLAAEKFLVAHPERARQVAVREYGSERREEILIDWRRYRFALGLDQSLLLTMEDQAQWARSHGRSDVQTIPNYLAYIYPYALRNVKPGAVNLMGYEQDSQEPRQ
ncbi:MAG: ABC transporter substrate-binding protein [Candidatus Pacebacteria bacterium]|nr:ABC transporter substrate-binding protein [Candidatus Paceibacterota bacterium]